jgi:hypothetical protein
VSVTAGSNKTNQENDEMKTILGWYRFGSLLVDNGDMLPHRHVLTVTSG